MSTQSAPDPARPLLDPLLFEQAGRQLRRWLVRLRQPHLVPAAEERATAIAWEDGEPPDDAGVPPAAR